MAFLLFSSANVFTLILLIDINAVSLIEKRADKDISTIKAKIIAI